MAAMQANMVSDICDEATVTWRDIIRELLQVNLLGKWHVPVGSPDFSKCPVLGKQFPLEGVHDGLSMQGRGRGGGRGSAQHYLVIVKF